MRDSINCIMEHIEKLRNTNRFQVRNMDSLAIDFVNIYGGITNFLDSGYPVDIIIIFRFSESL